MAQQEVDDWDSRAELGTSVGKALALLNAFDAPAASLGVTELARRVGVPKSTAFRLLAALESSGFLERKGTAYCLGPRLFELGNLVSYCRPRNLRDVALPYLSDLYDRSHETVHLAVLDGSDVLYLEKLFGHNKVPTPSHVGRRVPAYCTALGKAILAFSDDPTVASVLAQGLQARTPYTIAQPTLFRAELETVRRDGIAYDREESAIGLTCVAAPILSRGQAIAAISVSGASRRYDPSRLARFVTDAATSVSRELRR